MSLEIQSQHTQWRKNGYLISTDPDLIPIPALNEMFAMDDFYWATPLPVNAMHKTLNNSLCFGLYRAISPESASKTLRIEDNMDSAGPALPRSGDETLELAGFGRCITDYTTFMYLTDVYVRPQHRGHGLGAWLVGCVQEVIESMPYLRRSVLLTSDWERSVPFYERTMDMAVVEIMRPINGGDIDGPALLMRKGRGHPENYCRDPSV